MRTAQHAGETFDCEAALAACAHGDRRALQALYDMEAARMLGVARRITAARCAGGRGGA